MADDYSGDYSLVPIEHDPFQTDLGASMSAHLRGNPGAGPGPNPAQAFLDWRNSGEGWTDRMHAAMQSGDLQTQIDLLGGFAGSTMDMPLFHGSPVPGLSELKSSTRGPLGPGVYTSPAEGIAKSYAGDAGTLYQLPEQSRDIFLGIGHRTDDQWFGFKQDKQRLIDAAEPEKQQAVSDIIDKMWSNDGYPTYARIAQLYGGDAPAQALFKKAGFQGVSGLVDGPEVLLFGDQQLKPPAVPGIRAFHGSPYDFNAFDLSKIGTGEGAQAYGHGLYFAENPETAQAYRDALSKSRVMTVGDQKFTLDVPNKSYAEQSTQERALNNIRRFAGVSTSPNIDEVFDAAIRHVKNDPDVVAQISQWKSQGASFDAGKMYEVNINADPAHFLDWDKPLREQSPQVQQAVRNIRAISPEDKQDILTDPGYSGMHLIQGGLGSDQAEATAALRQAGIPGIKYLDQGSRGSGQGTSNYVVFDDKLVDIIRKYGIAGLIAGGASHFSTMPVDHDPYAQGGDNGQTVH